MGWQQMEVYSVIQKELSFWTDKKLISCYTYSMIQKALHRYISNMKSWINKWMTYSSVSGQIRNWAARNKRRWIYIWQNYTEIDLKWYMKIDATCWLTSFSWSLIDFSSLQHHRTSLLAMPTLPLKHDILLRVLWAIWIVIVGVPW